MLSVCRRVINSYSNLRITYLNKGNLLINEITWIQFDFCLDEVALGDQAESESEQSRIMEKRSPSDLVDSTIVISQGRRAKKEEISPLNW